MPTALITGSSGAGKTSVAAELARRGWRAIDTDIEPGLARWEGPDGAVVERPKHPSHEWLAVYRWAWDAARFEDLVAEVGPGWLVLCGNSSNATDFIERIDRIVLLEIDVATMLRRLDKDTRDNDFGAVGDTRDQLIRWLPGYQERLRAIGADVIDATGPLDAVVEAVESRLRVEPP